MRKTIASLSVAAALAIPALASAQAPAPSPITGNAGLFSQYIFRGLAQTGGRPALQGGADYAHSSGAYLGTWLSNVSWLNDANAYKESSLEWDLYGGYKGSLAGAPSWATSGALCSGDASDSTSPSAAGDLASAG